MMTTTERTLDAFVSKRRVATDAVAVVVDAAAAAAATSRSSFIVHMSSLLFLLLEKSNVVVVVVGRGYDEGESWVPSASYFHQSEKILL